MNLRSTSKAIGMLFEPVIAILMSPLRFAHWADGWLRWWTRVTARRWMFFVLVSALAFSVVATRTSRLEIRFQIAGADSSIPSPGPERAPWAAERRAQEAANAPEDARTRGAETVYLPPLAVLRFLSLGHTSFMADMLFIRAHGYFTTHLWLDRRFPWLSLYVDAIVGLDPDNERVYFWASQVIKFGQLIDEETLERSNRYSRLGIERFPDNWEFYRDVGANYLFEGRKLGAKDRLRRLEKALPYIKIATTLPNSNLDPNFAMNLLVRDNNPAAALHLAYITYWRAEPEQRRNMEGRMTRLGQKARAHNIARTMVRWKETFPYVRRLGLFRLIETDSAQDESLPTDWSKT